jgi:proteic killer suppression protein
MIQSFINQGTEDIFNSKNTIIARKLDPLDSVSSVSDLRIPPGNKFEALSGNRKGQYSIRINEQYRICFKWGEAGPEKVEIADYQ